jgi:hypothetical protein
MPYLVLCKSQCSVVEKAVCRGTLRLQATSEGRLLPEIVDRGTRPSDIIMRQLGRQQPRGLRCSPSLSSWHPAFTPAPSLPLPWPQIDTPGRLARAEVTVLLRFSAVILRSAVHLTLGRNAVQMRARDVIMYLYGVAVCGRRPAGIHACVTPPP